MSTEILHKATKKTLEPQLRFPEFEDNWVNTILGELADINPKNGNLPDNFIYIDLESVNNGILEKENLISKEDAPSRAQRILKKDDILYQTVRPYQKNNLYFDKNSGNYIASTGYAQLRTKSNSKFLYQLLHTDKFVSKVLLRSTGTSYPSINSSDLSEISISIPKLPEQQKIASFLSAVDEKIQQLTRKKELLEQYKKGVMQQLFSGKLRFKDDKGNDFPEWKKVNGNILFENISNKNHNSDLPILAITQDQGAVPRDLIDYKISVTDKSVDSYKVVEIGDFVISLRSFQGGIEYSEYKGICSPAYIILRPTSDNVNRQFYKRYLKTSSYIKELQKNLEGIRDGKMISYKYFSDIKLPFPCKEEQQKIADFLSSIDAKIENVNQQVNQAQKFKKGLLQQLFV